MSDLEPTYDEDGWRWRGPYISVTTVLGQAVVNKMLESYYKKTSYYQIEKTRARTSKFGTDAHEYFAKILLGEQFDCPETHTQHVAKFQEWVLENAVKAEHCELTLVSEELGICGQADFIGTVGGEGELCDWKTSRRFAVTNGWQMAAYRRMAIEQGVINDSYGLRGLQINRETAEIKSFKYKHLDYVEHKFLCALEVFKGLYDTKLRKLNWPWLDKRAVK